MLIAGRVALLEAPVAGGAQDIGSATGTITLTGVPGAISLPGDAPVGMAVTYREKAHTSTWREMGHTATRRETP